MPGGALCELRNEDELWCRQRHAGSRNIYLPSNAAWPMRPVGVRVLRDCRIVALESESPVRLKGRVEQNRTADEAEPWPPARKRPAWKYVDPRNPTPLGDGMVKAFKECFEELLLFNRRQYEAVKRFDFVALERLLGYGTRDERGRLQLRRTQHGLFLQQLDADLGQNLDVPAFERGYRLGHRICFYLPVGLDTLGGIEMAERAWKPRGYDARAKATADEKEPSDSSKNDGQETANNNGPEADSTSGGSATRPDKTKRRVRQDPSRADGMTESDPYRDQGAPHDLTDDQVVSNFENALDVRNRKLFEAIRAGASDATEQADAAMFNHVRPTGKRIRLKASATSGPPQTVLVGPHIGRGAFGEVFDLIPADGAPPREVIKIIHNNTPVPAHELPPGYQGPRTDGALSVKRQVEGAGLLVKAGIDTPLVADYNIGAGAKDLSYVIMEKIDVTGGALEPFSGTRFPKGAKKIAVIDLFERMIAHDLVGADLHEGNLYFYADRAGKVRAGVWDTDFILDTSKPIDPLSRQEFMRQIHGKQQRQGATWKGFDFADPRGSMEQMYRLIWDKR